MEIPASVEGKRKQKPPRPRQNNKKTYVLQDFNVEIDDLVLVGFGGTNLTVTVTVSVALTILACCFSSTSAMEVTLTTVRTCWK